tara:strand:- start:702 stop:887 length:186 start_codon:yes stop_codon:yes gene_type:complete
MRISQSEVMNFLNGVDLNTLSCPTMDLAEVGINHFEATGIGDIQSIHIAARNVLKSKGLIN